MSRSHPNDRVLGASLRNSGPARLGFACLLVAALAGCAARDPLGVWRRDLARYVENQGGDPTSLRDLPGLRSSHSLRPGQVVFGTLDVPGPGPLFFQTFWDLQGVLVGQRTIEGRHWYVFLVGRLARSPDGAVILDEIRPAAFCMEGTRVRWRTADVDEAALSRYRSRTSGVERTVLPRFPRTEDVFRLDVRGEQATITEDGTGVRWTLTLGGETGRTAQRASSRRLATR